MPKNHHLKIKLLARKHIIITTYHNKKIGCLKFQHPEDAAGKRNIEILWIYVKPQYRRKGIATQMLKFFVKHFTNIVWISTWTGKELEKEKAWNLYKKIRFKQIAYQADYYEQGIGTRLFVKKNRQV